jgi:hypothetical protein
VAEPGPAPARAAKKPAKPKPQADATLFEMAGDLPEAPSRKK